MEKIRSEQTCSLCGLGTYSYGEEKSICNCCKDPFHQINYNLNLSVLAESIKKNSNFYALPYLRKILEKDDIREELKKHLPNLILKKFLKSLDQRVNSYGIRTDKDLCFRCGSGVYSDEERPTCNCCLDTIPSFNTKINLPIIVEKLIESERRIIPLTHYMQLRLSNMEMREGLKLLLPNVKVIMGKLRIL